jgi:formylglycine-generating enzyme required for sulfatase activity
MAYCAIRIAELLADGKALISSGPAVRAPATLAMSRLGDSRFHGPDMLCLPNDEILSFVGIGRDPQFRIGTRSDHQRGASAMDPLKGQLDAEFNDGITPAPDFHVAHFPVTVAQFRVYVESSGLAPLDIESLRDAPTESVRYVTWDEAHAYCERLSARCLELSDKNVFKNNNVRLMLQAGQRFMLPGELEWEKAARGGMYTTYSWGDDERSLPLMANVPESGIGSVSACGCFSPNAYGLYDMTGTVLEWTSRFYAPYAEGAFDGAGVQAGVTGRTATQGGAYNMVKAYARYASRRKTHPVFRYRNQGFRLVSRSAES